MSTVMKRKCRVGFRTPGFRLYSVANLTHDLSKSLASLVLLLWLIICRWEDQNYHPPKACPL